MPELQVPQLDAESSHVITGGTGGLGLLFAAWLAELGVQRLALVSRSGRIQDAPSQALLDQANEHSTLRIFQGDIISEAEVGQILEQAGSTTPVKGIWHAAGCLDDHLLADITNEHLQRVLQPKVEGTLNLHRCSERLGLEIGQFVMFSSLAAFIGMAGQGNYCAANAFMDAFASYRLTMKLPAVAVQWGPWAEVGMAVRAETSETIALRISCKEGLAAMETILAGQSGGHLPAVVGVARIKWSSYLAQFPQVPNFLDNFRQHAPKRDKSRLVAGAAPSADLVRAGVENVLKEALDSKLDEVLTPH